MMAAKDAQSGGSDAVADAGTSPTETAGPTRAAADRGEARRNRKKNMSQTAKRKAEARQKDAGAATESAAGEDEEWKKRRDEHRRRQRTVRRILNRTFGPMTRSKPELWERRAYLMLVGLVYEWLAKADQEPSTDELIALAKVLAPVGTGRASRDKGKPSERSPGSGSRSRRLPKSFASVVKQVYGTDFQRTADHPPAEDTGANKQ